MWPMSIDRKLPQRYEHDADAGIRRVAVPPEGGGSKEPAEAEVNPRQEALLDTIVALRLGPEAGEETRARERERIVEVQHRITENVLERVRAMAKQRNTPRHGSGGA
jgi:hypothetical protein